MIRNRIMRDSTDLAGIPRNTPYVAAYINGKYANYHEAVSRFRHVESISVFGSEPARFYDVENGDYTPQSVVPNIERDKKAGWLSYVYCNLSTWPAVKQALHDAGLLDWQADRYWIAWYQTPPRKRLVQGARLVQYLGANPGNWNGPYDESVMAFYCPGIDGPKSARAIIYRLRQRLRRQSHKR